jgi:nitroreductase
MEVMDAIRQRRSVRAYAPDPIPDEKLKVVLEAAHLAPTACNYQPFKLVIVTDDATRRALVPACAGQAFVAEAPAIIVGCAFEEQAYQRQAGSYSSFAIDLSIVFDHITLAAVDQGLATCWIGAFDEQAVRDVVGVPQDVRVVALTPLGVPADDPTMPPRKPIEDLVCYEKWE